MSRTTRRTFIQSTAASAAAIAAASNFAAPAIFASDKAGTKKPIVGEGEYQYEATHDWAMENLPHGASYGGASHGVTIDKDGFIYISHYGEPGSIFVFDGKGKFVRSMGNFDMVGPKQNHHGGGHGIDLREENGEQFIYLAPSESSLPFTKINLKGEVVWNKTRAELNKDSGKYPGHAAYRPTNTSFTPDGGYYLGDGYGSSYVHQYDKSGKYLRTLGGRGKADGQFNTPHGHWLDDRDGTPKLAVCDRENNRLQWFDLDGKHLKTMNGFLRPCDIDIRKDGLMVVPELSCRVTLMDKNDKIVARLGGQGDFDAWLKKCYANGLAMRSHREWWQPGRFIHPHDSCFDHEGNIFVTEWVVTGRVTHLRRLA